MRSDGMLRFTPKHLRMRCAILDGVLGPVLHEWARLWHATRNAGIFTTAIFFEVIDVAAGRSEVTTNAIAMNASDPIDDLRGRMMGVRLDSLRYARRRVPPRHLAPGQSITPGRMPSPERPS